MKLHFVLTFTLCLFVDDARNEENDPFPVEKEIASGTVGGASLALDGNIVWSCPAETKKDKKHLKLLTEHKSYIYGYCLFQKLFKNQPKTCTEEVKPILKARLNSSGMLIQCGPKPNYIFYGFGFLFCGAIETLRQLEDEELQEEIDRFHLYANFILNYSLCVDTKTGLAKWTVHNITSPPSLPKDSNEDEQDLPISTDPLAFKKGAYQQIQQVYANQKRSKFKMNANSLVPKNHVGSNVWQKSANHYIIVAPLWDRLQKLMNAINESIKKLHFILQAQNQFLIIYTKAVDLSKRTYQKAGSMAFSQNVWYKLLYLQKQQTAAMIVIQNTPEKPPGLDTKLCKIRIRCSIKSWLEKLGFAADISDEDLQYAFCCRPTQAEVLQIFDQGLHIVETLRLDELLTNDPITLEQLKS